jgi:hypothetical protein
MLNQLSASNNYTDPYKFVEFLDASWIKSAIDIIEVPRLIQTYVIPKQSTRFNEGKNNKEPNIE